MKQQLVHIAKIQTGLFAKPEAKGEVVYLQVKHFDENGQLRTELFPDLRHDKVTEKHLLKKGDILFASKGTKNFAAVYEDHNPDAVASTSFFVIRLKVNQIIPEYLAWFLNQPSTLKYLKERAIGTTTPSISKAVLDQLEIPAPNLEKQKKIIALANLLNQEKSLKKRIDTLKKRRIQQIILSKIK